VMRNLIFVLCLFLIAKCELQNTANPFGQVILAYYSGVGIDTVGSGGLNSISLSFFFPGAMAVPSCDFNNPQTPCVRPAAGAGPSLGLSWAMQTISTAAPMLQRNSRTKPIIFFAFGGQSEGGSAWDQIFGQESTASNFGQNCAGLVRAVANAIGNSAFIGIDLDIEGMNTKLPFFGKFITSFRSLAGADSYPLLLDSLSGLSNPSSSDHFKVDLMKNMGPQQGGITFLNMMVNNVQASCATMSAFWRDPNLDFIPPGNKVLGFWGENLSAWILKNPGCTDGSNPLYPWMKSNGVGIGIWQWWIGPTNDITAVINQIKQ